MSRVFVHLSIQLISKRANNKYGKYTKTKQAYFLQYRISRRFNRMHKKRINWTNYIIMRPTEASLAKWVKRTLVSSNTTEKLPRTKFSNPIQTYHRSSDEFQDVEASCDKMKSRRTY